MDHWARMAWVFVAAGLGASLRWQLAVWLNPLLGMFLLGTLLANILGCGVAGVVAGLAMHKLCSPGTQTVLMAGFAGGLSTMSALAVEAVEGMEQGRWLAAGGLALLHVACSFGAAWAGLMLVRRWVAA